MQCPKCRTENPNNAQICSTCGYVFKNDTAEQSVAKPKISRLAIASLVLSIFGLFTLLIATALSIALAIASLYRIKKYKTEFKGKYLAVTAITISVISIIVLLAIFVLWNTDAPPIPDDYTIADLRSAPAECAGSYELLMSIAEKGEYPPDAPLIGLSAQDVNTTDRVSEVFTEDDCSEITEMLKENADSIYQAWENAKKGRDIINELNTFPEIADLTVLDINAEIGFLRNLRLLARLHRAYVCLQTEQGNSQIAINELIKLDSVFRKLSVNTRSTVTKLVCIAGLAYGIKAANFIVNNPQTSGESLELLSKHSTPLTKEQTSLRNSVISEYLMFKKTLDTQLAELRKTPFLKRNSTSRLYKNFADRWIAVEENQAQIEQLTVWPALYPELPVTIDSDGNFPWYYKVYNPIGSLLVGILMPALDRVFEIKMKLQIHSDLLQIVLNKRLGKEVSLKAHAYSDEYIIDVDNKKIFSPGPDGEPNTKDDIKLTINPEALGLLSK